MKKKFSYLVLAALSLVGLVSCGSKEEAAKTEITVQVETSWKPYYEEVIKKVMETHPNAEIKIKEAGSFDQLDLIDSTDVTNPDIADVFAFPLDRLTGLAQKGALAGFDAKALADKVGGFGDYDNGLGGQLKLNDEYLGFPLNIETLVTFVNTANAKANGIDFSKPVDISNAKVNEVLIPLFNAWWGVAITNGADIELLGMKDGKFYSDLTKNYEDLTDSQRKAIDGLYEYWKINADAKTSIFDNKAAYGYMDEQFKVGNKGSIKVSGPWDVPNFMKQTNEGKDLEILPLSQITLNGQALKHWKGGWALGINARIEEDKAKLELAQDLIAEIMNRDNAVKFFEVTGKIMPHVTKEVFENSELSDINKKVVASVISSYNESVARPLFIEWGKVWQTWENGILSWNTAKPKNAQEAYKELSASFKAMMENIENK
ncbi:sugar ABC transporter substrate-binding protein [Oceanivirga salmonicida]|uniref:sugar ABC transporter substrate-binding protein n=1 Tax=Oceanivirga salmonicida TaxID=1769291 RepID=UPI0012E1C7DE|nr:sugar ABC transporter substrate-binding protein [Oceanivirga salmonicida]